MLIKAKGILEYVIEIQTAIFSDETITKIESYFNNHVIDQDFFLINLVETENVINELVLAETPGISRAFLDIVSPKILVSVYKRFEYFEQTMKKLVTADPDAVVELHSSLSSVEGLSLYQIQVLHENFLRFGLIDLWNDRMKIGPYYRKN